MKDLEIFKVRELEIEEEVEEDPREELLLL